MKRTTKRSLSLALGVLLTGLLLSPPGALPLAACDDEGPGLVAARITATLSPDDAAKITVEKFDGTLVVKGIVLRGTAAWDDAGAVLAEGPVTVKAMILTTGDETTALRNRGILWAQYEFRDAVTDAVVGTGEGFTTLEQLLSHGGAASFQGSITLEGAERQFAGTGETGICGLLPASLAGAIPACDGGDDGEESDLSGGPGLAQEMAQTVITGAKPGFGFENTRNVTQLNRQFGREVRKLGVERYERLRVLRSVR